MKHAHDEGQGLVDQRLGEIAADDAFLDALAAGTDPTGGADPLAGLLLELKQEIESTPMPAAPVLPGVFAHAEKQGTVSDAPTTVIPVVAAHPGVPSAPVSADTNHAVGTEAAPSVPAAPTPDGAEVIDLNSRRRRRGSSFMSGLVGAAAATLLIAGSGVAIHNATPGSPLWGANVAIFGDHAAVVELATTLEEAGSRTDSGDIQGALELLDKAKAMATDLSNQKAPQKPVEAPRTTVTQREVATDTVTVTATPTVKPEEKKSEAPATVVSTVTKTVAPPAEIDPVAPERPSSTPAVTSPVEIPEAGIVPEPTPEVAEVDPIAATTTIQPSDDGITDIDTRINP